MQNSHRLGFTPTRLAVLRFIDEPGAFRSMPVRAQHFTVAVRALKAAGLVRENTDPAIRRVYVLTEDGVQALTEARLAETTFDPQRARDRAAAPARTVTLTDLIDPDNTVTVPLDQVAAAMRPWWGPALESAPGSIAVRADLEKADELQRALIAGDLVAAAEIAGEIGVGYDLNPA